MESKSDNLIHLLLVNEIRLMGNILTTALVGEPDIHVVDCVNTSEGALKIIQESTVDVVLVSTRLPDQGALALTSAISEKAPHIKVLALGLTEEKKRVLQFIEAGAAGYVLKDNSLEDLVFRVRTAHAGNAVVSPMISAAMMERLSALAQMFSNIENSFSDEADLTPREVEVLEKIEQGLTNQQIATALVIEIGTVKNHVHNIFEKLNVRSRGEAAAYLTFRKK